MDIQYKYIVRENGIRDYAIMFKDNSDLIDKPYSVLVYATSPIGIILKEPLFRKDFASKWKAKFYFFLKTIEYKKQSNKNFKFL